MGEVLKVCEFCYLDENQCESLSQKYTNTYALYSPFWFRSEGLVYGYIRRLEINVPLVVQIIIQNHYVPLVTKHPVDTTVKTRSTTFLVFGGK